MKMDKCIAAEITALKDKYKVSSIQALKYYRSERKYNSWKEYIEKKLNDGFGDFEWKPATREVANLADLSFSLTHFALNDPQRFKADHRQAVLNFYMAINRKHNIACSDYFEATYQLLPPQAIVNGKIIPLIGTYYILPDRKGSHTITEDLDGIELDDDLIEIVKNWWNPDERIYLFSDIDSAESWDEVKRIGGLRMDGIASDCFYDPVYVRAHREGMLRRREYRRRISTNFMVSMGITDVDAAIRDALENIEIVNNNILDEQIKNSFLVVPIADSENFVPTLLYERRYFEYLIESLRGNRRFLETEIGKSRISQG